MRSRVKRMNVVFYLVMPWAVRARSLFVVLNKTDLGLKPMTVTHACAEIPGVYKAMFTKELRLLL